MAYSVSQVIIIDQVIIVKNRKIVQALLILYNVKAVR